MHVFSRYWALLLHTFYTGLGSCCGVVGIHPGKPLVAPCVVFGAKVTISLMGVASSYAGAARAPPYIQLGPEF